MSNTNYCFIKCMIQFFHIGINNDEYSFNSDDHKNHNIIEQQNLHTSPTVCIIYR